jgi:uncharacterized protein YycO
VVLATFERKFGVVLFGIIVTIFASLLFAGSTQAASYKEGDILVTSSTSFWGFTGHAGIVARSADGDLYAVHIPRSGEPIQKYTLSKWESKYPKTEIWRHNNSTAARQAGQKAMDFVRYYGTATAYIAPYDLIGSDSWDLTNKNAQYCSKLVWQSYYYGPGYNLGFDPNKSKILVPYELRGLANMYKVGGSL